MRLFKTILLMSILSGLLIDLEAQSEKKLIGGNSFNIMIPQGKLADTYDHGFGFFGNFDYNLNKHFALRFDLGWNDVSGEETTIVDQDGTVHTNHPNMSVWEFTGGLKAGVSIFYLEGRGGYYTGIGQWGIVPAAGLRIKKFDIQGSYTFAGEYEWFSARIAYYWAK